MRRKTEKKEKTSKKEEKINKEEKGGVKERKCGYCHGEESFNWSIRRRMSSMREHMSVL
jgi:hypothetical protein